MTTALTPAADAGHSTPTRSVSHAGTSSPPVDLHAGLTVADVARISAAIAAGRADSTRAVYAYAWRRFERWCATRGISPQPAAPAAVCAYLTEFAEHGVTVATIEVASAAIADAHRSHGLDDPVATRPYVRCAAACAAGSEPRLDAKPAR